MKIIAENANDFASIRTMDKGNCIYIDKTDYFHRLVTAQGRPCVVLIDGYDDPVARALANPAEAELIREELGEYFGEHMAAHAKAMGLSDDAYRAELKRRYNGYRFSPDNPVRCGAFAYARPGGVIDSPLSDMRP